MSALHLKPWRKEEIQQEDWDFSGIVEAVPAQRNERIQFLRWAWKFEADRELGSHNPPFLIKWKQAGKPWPFQREWAMRKHYFGKFLAKHGSRIDEGTNYVLTKSAGHHYTDAHVIEIDWEQSEERIIEDFRQWLRNSNDHPPTAYKKDKSNAGRKDSYRSYLDDLAIFRLSEAGYTRREALGMLGRQSNSISAPNWSHARKRTLQRIESRYCELWRTAQHCGKHWQDFFIPL